MNQPITAMKEEKDYSILPKESIDDLPYCTATGRCPNELAAEAGEDHADDCTDCPLFSINTRPA